MATTQEQWENVIGLTTGTTLPGNPTLALSGADGNTWLALSFVVPAALTLSKVKAYVSAVAGSGTLSVSCDLYSDAATGVPNASIESKSLNIAVSGFAAGFKEWTGFTTTLTAGTRYWLVFKNTTATPATNYPTFRWTGGSTMGIQMAGAATIGWAKVHTTDGSAWTQTPAAGVGGYRLEFSDAGTPYAGIPIETSANTVVAQGVYGARELGVKFTTPANVKLNVRGLAFAVSRAGTLADDLVFRIYTGDSTSPGASTVALPKGIFPTSPLWYYSLFASKQTLQPNTTYRITIATLSGGDTSNYYRSYEHTIENDAGSKALFPWGAQRCYLNTTWTDVDTSILPFGLILDTDGEAAAPIFPAVGNTRIGSSAFGWNGEYTPTKIIPGEVDGSGYLVLAKETSEARSGACAKLAPSHATNYGYWYFYIPATASTEFTLSFYAKKGASFNGNLKVTIYDTDQSTPLNTSEDLTGDLTTSYTQLSCTPATPTDDGLCLVRVEVNGTADSVYVDDISLA